MTCSSGVCSGLSLSNLVLREIGDLEPLAPPRLATHRLEIAREEFRAKVDLPLRVIDAHRARWGRRDRCGW